MCDFCQQIYRQNASKMTHHLLQLCKSVPSFVKRQLSLPKPELAIIDIEENGSAAANSSAAALSQEMGNRSTNKTKQTYQKIFGRRHRFGTGK